MKRQKAEGKKAAFASDRSVFLFLLLWSVAVLYLMSIDSPLHGAWDRLDSAIFFTSGKALMSGMRPYVDFADSKGPLLWLIYGVGYLLSPHTYHGVWLLSCLAYGGILYYNYKTALLLLGEWRSALAVAMVMPFFYLQYWFHDVVRAEDFAAFFLSVSLYHMLRVLCGREGRVEDVRQVGLTLGGCFMSLVLIKYNIAAMQAAMTLVVVFACLRHGGRQAGALVRWGAAGLSLVALPFVVYLLARGSFSAFVTEYFVNTLNTVGYETAKSKTYLEEVSSALGTRQALAMLMTLTLSGWMASLRLSRLRYAPLFVAWLSFAICMHHTLFHYYNICSVFLIFLPVHVVGLVRLRMRDMAAIGACMLAWGVYENTREGTWQHRVCHWTEKTHEEYYKYFSSQIQGHHPSILYLYGCDYGYGLASGALPAGKYWTYQLGMTPEMELEHVRPLLEGSADYIVVNDYQRCERKGFDDRRISSYGYTMVCMQPYYNHKGQLRENMIYKRRDL